MEHHCPQLVLFPARRHALDGSGAGQGVAEPQSKHLTKSDMFCIVLAAVFLVGVFQPPSALMAGIGVSPALHSPVVLLEGELDSIPVAPPVELQGVTSIVPLGYQEGGASASRGRSPGPLRGPGMALPLNLPCGPGSSDRAAAAAFFSPCWGDGGGSPGPRGLPPPSAWLSSWIPEQ